MSAIAEMEPKHLKSRVRNIRDRFAQSEAVVKDSIFRLAPDDLANRDNEAMGFTDWRQWSQWSQQQ